MKIQQTEDYNLFKRIKGNRTLNRAQIRRLNDSFNKNPELSVACPIIINDKKEIIDGQHRFEALRQQNLPIYYLELNDLNLKSVQILNSATKTWRPVDYAISFSELGNKNYTTYLEFKNEYYFAHTVILLVLTEKVSWNSEATFKFNNGEFKVGDLELARELSDRLLSMKEYYSKGDTRVFATAFKRATVHPEYDHQRMLAKMKQYGDTIKDSLYIEEYMREIERIYNHHMMDSNRVKLF